MALDIHMFVHHTHTPQNRITSWVVLQLHFERVQYSVSALLKDIESFLWLLCERLNHQVFPSVEDILIYCPVIISKVLKWTVDGWYKDHLCVQTQIWTGQFCNVWAHNIYTIWNQSLVGVFFFFTLSPLSSCLFFALAAITTKHPHFRQMFGKLKAIISHSPRSPYYTLSISAKI